MWVRYFKGQPTDHVIRYAGGRPAGEGPAKSFFYWRYNTQVVAVPTASQDVPFVFNEITRDHQQVTIQGQATFRIGDPRKAAELFNFAIDPATQQPLSEDREKLRKRVANLIQVATRGEVSSRALEEVLADTARQSGTVAERLRREGDLETMGVELLAIEFLAVRPTPEVAKALEAELRETLLRRADVAVYARRAATVDEERAIREKELASDKALEEQRAEMIALQAANALAEAESAAAAARITSDAAADAERKRLAVWSGLDPRELTAHALRALAADAGKIGALNVTTELLASLLGEEGKPPPPPPPPRRRRD